MLLKCIQHIKRLNLNSQEKKKNIIYIHTVAVLAYKELTFLYITEHSQKVDLTFLCCFKLQLLHGLLACWTLKKQHQTFNRIFILLSECLSANFHRQDVLAQSMPFPECCRALFTCAYNLRARGNCYKKVIT